MSLYQIAKTANDVEIIVKDNEMWIPCDETNTDYQAYLAWVAEGNTAEEWQPESEGI